MIDKNNKRWEPPTLTILIILILLIGWIILWSPNEFLNQETQIEKKCVYECETQGLRLYTYSYISSFPWPVSLHCKCTSEHYSPEAFALFCSNFSTENVSCSDFSYEGPICRCWERLEKNNCIADNKCISDPKFRDFYFNWNDFEKFINKTEVTNK